MGLEAPALELAGLLGGIDELDRRRFWSRYRRRMGLRFPGLEGRLIRARAARYLAHNRKTARVG